MITSLIDRRVVWTDGTGVLRALAYDQRARLWFALVEPDGGGALAEVIATSLTPEQNTAPGKPMDLSRPLADLELSTRAVTCLQNAGIKTIGELARKTPADLLRMRGAGTRTVREIVQQLAACGLRLAGGEGK